MILIGLAGPPGAGQNTVARYLHQRHNFVRYVRNVPPPLVRAHIGDRIVVIDVQAEGEAEYLRAGGAQIWHIQRPGYLTRAGDVYKGIVPASADRGLLNDGLIDALYNRIDRLLDDLSAASLP